MPASGSTSRWPQHSGNPFSGGRRHRHERKRATAAEIGSDAGTGSGDDGDIGPGDDGPGDSDPGVGVRTGEVACGGGAVRAAAALSFAVGGGVVKLGLFESNAKGSLQGADIAPFIR